MRIVRPISAHDADLLEQSLTLLRHFGRLENHSITFAPAQSVRHLAEEAAAAIGDLTNDVTVLALDFEGQDTWPQSPNLHWTLTMEALLTTGNKDPIFWMELDCDPIMPNWADTLETAWRTGRQPFCGFTTPKPGRNAAGAIVYEPDDLMMMGCAVYPWNIAAAQNWNVLVKGFHSGTNEEPWDVFLRGWMRGLGWSHTDLIGDRWNTINYKEGFICEPGPTKFKGRNHSRTDISKACVVHGCKDGTLGRLILEGALPKMAPKVTAQIPPAANASAITGDVFAPAPPAPESHEEILASIQSLERTLSVLAQNIATLSKQVQEALSKLDSLMQPNEEPQPTKLELVDTSPPEEKATLTRSTTPDLETIRGILNERKLQIGPLAESLKMDKESLRQLILKKGSGLTLKKGWVGLDAA